MTSENVIRDFSIPAFRVKQDLLSQRNESLWFEIGAPGTFELVYTRLCGVILSNNTPSPIDFGCRREARSATNQSYGFRLIHSLGHVIPGRAHA
ncbi:MAG: hypothetical protein AB7U61_16540 [Methylocystis sp.]